MLARGPDGTVGPRKLRNCGISALDLRIPDGFQGPEVLEVGPPVEVGEPGEAQLADPLGRQFAAGALELGRDQLDDRVEVVAPDVALVGGAGKRPRSFAGSKRCRSPLRLRTHSRSATTRS